MRKCTEVEEAMTKDASDTVRDSADGALKDEQELKRRLKTVVVPGRPVVVLDGKELPPKMTIPDSRDICGND